MGPKELIGLTDLPLAERGRVIRSNALTPAEKPAPCQCSAAHDVKASDAVHQYPDGTPTVFPGARRSRATPRIGPRLRPSLNQRCRVISLDAPAAFWI